MPHAGVRIEDVHRSIPVDSRGQRILSIWREVVEMTLTHPKSWEQPRSDSLRPSKYSSSFPAILQTYRAEAVGEAYLNSRGLL